MTTVIFDTSFADARPTSTCHWFDGMYRMTRLIGLVFLNTSEVTNMSYMFGSYNKPTLDLSHFDTRKVTDMSRMFYGTVALADVDVSGFNTSRVTDMSYMFASSAVTELDLSGFDTSSVIDMSSMFEESYLETVTFGGSFNTASVENMSSMFAFTALTELDLSKFDTSSVTNMSSMFYGMPELVSVDLSGTFTVANTANVDSMFGDCESLSKIYVAPADANWDDRTRTGVGMFEGCKGLVGGSGTVYDAMNTGIGYAHVDGTGGLGAGYFTAR